MDSQQNVIYHDKNHDWNYYITTLFYQNKLYQNNNLNLLLLDLSNIWKSSFNFNKLNYYYNNLNEQFLFWNNNPLNKFIISGTIISYQWKFFNNNEFIIFSIDDNSFNNNLPKSIPQFIINKKNLPMDLLNNLNNLKNIQLQVSRPKFNYNTLEINKILNYNFNLLTQIEFWKLAIDDKLFYNDVIWNIERQKNNNNNSSKQLFIETLNNNIIKKNLQILSPYLEPQDTTTTTTNHDDDDDDDDSYNDISMISDLEKGNNQSHISLDSSSFSQSYSETTPISNITPRITLKLLNYNFLTTIYNYHQLRPTSTNITITDLYQFNGLTDLLNQYTSTHTTNKANATVMKSNLFNDILTHYQSIGLISLFNNNNDCNIRPYLKLLSFIDSKCKKWLKLQTKINTINFKQIKESFIAIIINLDFDTILSMYKVVLNGLTQGKTLITKWYIELDSNILNHKYALVHIIYP